MDMNINGKSYKLKFNRNPRNKPSGLHIYARCYLKEIYPFDILIEEVYIPKIKIYVDILLPSRKLAIEINGRQHYEYIPFFHKSKLDWLKAKQRDIKKKITLEENGIVLISLKYDETDQWKQQIQQSKI